MVKKILQIGNPILTTETERVLDIGSAQTKQIIEDLIDTCDKNRRGTAGLAAPQIGYNQSICVCRRTDLEGKDRDKLERSELWEVLINPKVITKSEDTSIIWEACLSIGVGKKNIWAPVERPRAVTVEFTTPAGETKQLTGLEFQSHVYQHEIDHLHGILFTSYVTNLDNLWTREQLDQYLDEHDEYPPAE